MPTDRGTLIAVSEPAITQLQYHRHNPLLQVNFEEYGVMPSKGKSATPHGSNELLEVGAAEGRAGAVPRVPVEQRLGTGRVAMRSGAHESEWKCPGPLGCLRGCLRGRPAPRATWCKQPLSCMEG